MARNKHSGNGHDRLHVTETPDVSHIKNLDVTHEASDVSVSGVLKFVLALTALCVVVFLLMGGMFRFLNTQETEKEAPPGPMAMKPNERLPPDPKLQAAPGFGVKLKNGEWVPLDREQPEAEYRVLLAQWERELSCAEAREAPLQAGEHDANQAGLPARHDPPAPSLTSNRGYLCMPIDQAMEKVIGLPSRVKASSQAGSDGQATDYGIDRPTAASSGRATERGREE